MAKEISFSQWLESAPGRCAMAWERECFARLVSDKFGYNALQLGVPEENFLAASRIGHCFVAALEKDYRTADILVDASALPFDSASVDLVVLPHVLEAAARPYAVLRELERVLVADGTILIAGFNPFGLWRANGVAQRISPLRMREWLALLGFELEQTFFGCYRPPFRSEKWLARAAFMERAGARWWPVGGGIYILQAVKRTVGMRLIEPKWRKSRVRVPLVAAGASRLAGKNRTRNWLDGNGTNGK